MPSPILSAATRLLLPLFLVLAFFLLIRGHAAPGGGFVGGLVAATGFTLLAIADGVAAARRVLRVDPRALLATGLAVALASGVAALALGRPFLSGLWLASPVPVLGTIGTPFLFDVGVGLLVLGMTLTVIFALMEE